MKKQLTFYLLVSLFASSISAQWQSDLVKQNADGTLTYEADADGFIIPDFSHAGYKGGGVEIPDIPVVKTIDPVSGDNTQHIQDAIDYAGSLPKDINGFRGAIMLNAGRYPVMGTLKVAYDGVIIRGVGEGEDESLNTIIFAPKNETVAPQRDVILMGNTTQIWGKSQISGTKTNITDATVPVGSYSFNVEKATPYQVGDHIIIYHPCTEEWLEAVNRGGVPYPDPTAPTDPDERWKVNQLPVIYNRYITAINGNTITIDAPVFYTLNKSLSQSYIYKANFNGTVYQVGIENLRIEIETDGGTDEEHAWQAIRFKSVENAWARNCTMSGFGQSGIITEACTRSTFENCSAIDPVAKVTGERMYNFNTYVYSQLNLFRNNYARNGRHHYMSNGTSTTSGNVFLRCISDAVNSVNEGHRQWTQGMLYDNHKEVNLKRDFVLGLYNRVAMGTGHGWSAVHSVLWNCDVDASKGRIGLQKPPTAQNYAIGCKAKSITGKPVNASDFPLGYVEGQNKSGLQPESLYEAQLNARIKSVDPNQRTAYDKITTNFADGTWGTIAASLPSSGSYPTDTINDFILNKAIVYAGSTTDKSGEKHVNRIGIDKKNNGGNLELPWLKTIGQLEIHAAVGTAGNTFNVDEYTNNEWTTLQTFSAIKADSTFYLNIERNDTTRLRISNNSGGSVVIWKVTSRSLSEVKDLNVFSTIPAQNSVCFYNLTKEVTVNFNKEITAGSSSLLLNETEIPLAQCRIEGTTVTIPVTLESTPGVNKPYALVIPAGAFIDKEDSRNVNNAYTLNFETLRKPNMPANYAEMIDIQYSDASAEMCRMDFYYPADAVQPTPVVINMHGGGWNHGAKEEQTGFGTFTSMGFAVANVEYRMTPQAKAPAAVEDVRCAMQYLLKNAASLNIDPNRIVFQGASAGGHLALTAAYLQNNRMYDTNCNDYQEDIKIFAVIDKYGPAHLSDFMFYTSLVNWLGSKADDEDFVKSISPAGLVNSTTPPTYIVHGDADPTVPYSQSVTLAEKLKAHNVHHQFTTIPGGKHGGFGDSYNTQISNEIIAFLTGLVNASNVEMVKEEKTFQPVVDNNKIYFNLPGENVFQIYDIAGNKIAETDAGKIDLSYSGVLIIKANNGNDTFTAKIIK